MNTITSLLKFGARLHMQFGIFGARLGVAPRIPRILILLLLFINTTTKAQTIVSSEVFTEGDYASSDISDNGTYVNIVVTNANNGQGLSKTLEKQNDGGFTIVNTFNLLKGPGSSDAVQYAISVTSDSGVTYVRYMYGWSGDDGLIRLQKNLPDGTSINVLEHVNDGIATMKVINGDLYAIFGVGANFNPGTLGGLPNNLTNGYHLMKISGTTDQYVWSTFLGNDFVWNDKVEIMKKPGDDVHLYLNKSDGSLVKFNLSDGTNLGAVKTGLENDKYRFESDGNLHRLVTSEHKLIIYDLNDDYNSILWETDWSQANLWNYGVDSWKIIDGKLYALRNDRIMHLNDELIHGYVSRSNLGIYGFGTQINWINNDGTFSYIKTDGGVKIITLNDGLEDESLLPTLNDSDPNIVAVVDGQTYNGSDWIDAYHQSTIVFANGTLPSVGDTPDENWLTPASGTHLVILFPIEVDPRSGKLMFRGACRRNGTAEDYINVRVTLVEESDVVLSVKNSEKDKLKIYPNPANDFINISFGLKQFGARLGVAPQIQNIVICDVSGRVVNSNPMTWSHRITMDISNLKSGIYFVKVFTEGGFFVERFVKER